MITWLAHHRDAIGHALRRWLRDPGGNLLSVLVLGVALSLPAGGFALLRNLEAVSGDLGGPPEISVFVERQATQADLAEIEKRIKASAAVARFDFVHRDQALEKLKRNAGLADVASALPENPLPHAYILHAADPDPDRLEALQQQISKWPRVEHVQMDSLWARRLQALVALGRMALLMLAALLGFALVAVTFNTIRLQLLTRRDEIEVSKLIGATDGYIRRPFLYFGLLQGLLGGAIAWAVVAGTVRVLNGPIADLGRLYGVIFRLDALAPPEAGALLAIAAGLGWVGAHLSVSRHLRAIEPR